MRCGRGAPPRCVCLLPSAQEDQEEWRPTRMMSEALRYCRRKAASAFGSAKANTWLPQVLRIAGPPALNSKGFPGEPGQGTIVREGVSRRKL